MTDDVRPSVETEDPLWGRLADMWETLDPAPQDLADQVLTAIAMDDIDAEYELLHLVERSEQLVGVRGPSESVTVSFAGSSFSLLLRVSPVDGNRRRIDGWVTPARVRAVTVRQQNRAVEAPVDASGRFEIASLPTGLSRFWLLGSPADDPDASASRSELFATPSVEL